MFNYRPARLAGSVGSTVLMALLASPSLSAQQQDDTETDTLSLDEIVITAERRAESIQTVPVAVSAFDENTMQRRQMLDTKSVIFNVPNLTGNSNVGQQTATTFFIRGVGTTESLATVDTTVAVYIDDVYVARQGVNNFNLFDVERIEVLRGPQGTLYGRNATGGAVKVVTKEPSAEPELNVDAAYGNYDRYRLRVSGNAPLVEDKVFFRGAFLTEQGDGFTENVVLDRDVNDLNYFGARGALKFILSDRVEATIAADWSRDEQNGMYGVDIGNITRPSSGDLFVSNSGEDIENVAETYGGSLHISWDINDNWNLESISGYRTTTQLYNLDISDQPVPIFRLSSDAESEQFTQELKVQGTIGDRLDLVAGLFYFTEESDVFLQDDFAPGGLTEPRTPILVSDRFYNVRTDSYAAFAQIDYDITDRLTLILGGRYTRDEKAIETNQIINGNQGFNDDALRALGVDLEPNFGEFTPKFGLDFQVTDDWLTYASYTRGFRSGGWQARVNNAAQFLNFPAEIVDSYEIGSKASLFDGRVLWNAAAFFAEYTDLFNSVPGADNTFLVATADAEIYGFESELTFRANEWLDLFANFGVLETSYKELEPAVDAQLGDELQRSPSFQGKAGFSVDYPMANGDSFLVNGDVFYTSEFFTNPQNGPFSQTGDFALVNASVGYRFDDGRYTISANCRNCLDEEYFDSILSFPGAGFVTVYPGNPRFYEIAVSLRF